MVHPLTSLIIGSSDINKFGTMYDLVKVGLVTKQEEKESFFHWFATPEMPTSMDDMDEDEAEHLEEVFENDFEIAQAFRNNIVPNAILWFTGQVRTGCFSFVLLTAFWIFFLILTKSFFFFHIWERHRKDLWNK